MKRTALFTLALLVFGVLLPTPGAALITDTDTTWGVHYLASNATAMANPASEGVPFMGMTGSPNRVGLTYDCGATECVYRLDAANAPTGWILQPTAPQTDGGLHLQWLNGSTWVAYRVTSSAVNGSFSHDDLNTWTGLEALSTTHINAQYLPYVSTVDGKQWVLGTDGSSASLRTFIETDDIYASPMSDQRGCAPSKRVKTVSLANDNPVIFEADSVQPAVSRILVMSPDCTSAIAGYTMTTTPGCTLVGASLARGSGLAFAFRTNNCNAGTTDFNGDDAVSGMAYWWDHQATRLYRIGPEGTEQTRAPVCTESADLDVCALVSSSTMSISYKFKGGSSEDFRHTVIPGSGSRNPTGVAFVGDRFYVSQHLSNGSVRVFYSSPIEVPRFDVLAPSEFDSGFVVFFESLGFKTPESKMFLTFALVGILNVTMSGMSRFISPGRTKNIVVAAPGILIGIFCAMVLGLQLWMFIIALVLGGFTLRGFASLVNTYHEIKARVQPTGPAVQVVDESVAAAPTQEAEPTVMFEPGATDVQPAEPAAEPTVMFEPGATDVQPAEPAGDTE